MANPSQVAEIFQQASLAFARLGQLTLNLKISQATSGESIHSNVKWTSEEITELQKAINQFGYDLQKLTKAIDGKTADQIDAKLKCRTFQETSPDPPSPSIKTVRSTHDVLDTGNSISENFRRKQKLRVIQNDADTLSVKRARSEPESTPEQDDLNAVTFAEGAVFLRSSNRVNTDGNDRTEIASIRNTESRGLSNSGITSQYKHVNISREACEETNSESEGSMETSGNSMQDNSDSLDAATCDGSIDVQSEMQ